MTLGLRFPGLILGIAGAQVVGVLALLPPGGRLRPFVDLLALEGLLLTVAGTFLVADRPFLAARTILKHVRGESGAERTGPELEEEVRKKEESRKRRRRERSFGTVVILLGGGLFGGAALLWAVFT